MIIKTFFFGPARDITSTREVEHTTVPEGTHVREYFAEYILPAYPGLADILPSSVLVLNLEYLDPDANPELSSGDEVGFIPPISGG